MNLFNTKSHSCIKTVKETPAQSRGISAQNGHFIIISLEYQVNGILFQLNYIWIKEKITNIIILSIRFYLAWLADLISARII